MCLILFAVNPTSDYRLVIAANRDEFFGRSTINAGYWPEYPDVLAGRDEQMGGTWLGVSNRARFAAVTNFREEPPEPMPPLSRGDLPLDFLRGNENPYEYTNRLSTNADQYRGYNLIVADSDSVSYYCNRTNERLNLNPGYYGLSNQVLDCDWPKVIDGRACLKDIIESEQDDLAESLFNLLLGSGDGREFSNSFIHGDQYGTRAASVVLWGSDGWIYFEERNFGPGAERQRTSSHTVNCNDGS